MLNPVFVGNRLSGGLLIEFLDLTEFDTVIACAEKHASQNCIERFFLEFLNICFATAH